MSKYHLRKKVLKEQELFECQRYLSSGGAFEDIYLEWDKAVAYFLRKFKMRQDSSIG
ncbi:MAG: hypothetical protein V7784_14760 [Oceanospirillaceae bacterium]